MLENNFALPLKWTALPPITITADGVTNGQALTATETPARTFMILPDVDNTANTTFGPTAVLAAAGFAVVPGGGGYIIPYVGQPIDLRDWFVSGTEGDVVNIAYM